MLPLLLAALPALLPTQQTTRVSVSWTGLEANDDSTCPAMTPDGRFVAFVSDADNLIPSDTNQIADTFLVDRRSGTIERISVGTGGFQATGPGGSWGAPSMSSDGRYVAFTSSADNLVPGDTNLEADVFIRDRLLDRTERVSVDGAGMQFDVESSNPTLSADGRIAAFLTRRTVPTQVQQVWVRDLRMGVSSRVDVDPQGTPAPSGIATDPFLSADGRFVTFSSNFQTLVASDQDGLFDVFVRDLSRGVTSMESLTASGGQVTDQGCFDSTLSADGRMLTFHSRSFQVAPVGTWLRSDCFLRDRRLGTNRLAHLVDGGGFADSHSYWGARVSLNGRLVSYASFAMNLTAGIPPRYGANLFRTDPYTLTTRLLSAAVVPLSSPIIGTVTYEAPMSADGRFTAFDSNFPDLVPADTNGCTDIFVSDLGSGSGIGTVTMTADLHATVGQPLELRWFCAEPGADWWLIGSRVASGRSVLGHPFDLGGGPVHLLDHGVVPPSGHGKAYTPALPAALAGTEVHFELVTRTAAGVLGDSNLVSRPVQ